MIQRHPTRLVREKGRVVVLDHPASVWEARVCQETDVRWLKGHEVVGRNAVVNRRAFVLHVIAALLLMLGGLASVAGGADNPQNLEDYGYLGNQAHADRVNAWLEEKRDDRQKKQQQRYLLGGLLALLQIGFTVRVLSKNADRPMAFYRLVAWYPLFFVGWSWLYAAAYFLVLALVPLHLVLWFQKSLPRKEVLLSGIPFAVGAVVLAGQFAAWAGLASQGAGH